MQTIKQQIPNLFTLGNLFCGCLAIKFAFEWDLVMAAYLVGLGAVLDFFDGFLARILKVQGELGKQLDSLADMVTFGVVPGVVMFQMMRLITSLNQIQENVISYNIHDTFYDIHSTFSNNLICYLAFLIPVLSAYRLAKFNIDTRQSDKFIGLPTPANAIFICSFPLIVQLNTENSLAFLLQPQSLYLINDDFLFFSVNNVSLFLNLNILIFFTILFSFLLISNLPLFALKFKSFGFRGNEIRYVFLGISATMLIIFQVLAIPFIVLLYLLMSVINNFTLKQ